MFPDGQTYACRRYRHLHLHLHRQRRHQAAPNVGADRLPAKAGTRNTGDQGQVTRGSEPYILISCYAASCVFKMAAKLDP